MKYSEMKIKSISAINNILNVVGIETREIIIDEEYNFSVICKSFKIETNIKKHYYNIKIYDKDYLNFIALSGVCDIIGSFNNNIAKAISCYGGDENEL